MIIIIDGYNVIRQHVTGEVLEHERRAFIKLVSDYGKKKKHKMVLVFDGGPYSWPHREVMNGTAIIYSGYKQTADEIIMHYIEDHQGKDILLVSSDYELNFFASQHAVVSTSSEDFYTLLREGMETPQIVDEIPSIEIDDQVSTLDELMEQASEVIPHKKVDHEVIRSIQKKGQLSRTDKLLMKKLKKL